MGEQVEPSGVRRVIGGVSRVLDYVQYALIGAVGVIAAVSALLLFYQVVDRLVFQGGQNWIDEFARLSLIWLTFLGAAVLIREGRHLAVDYFVGKMPAVAQKWVAIATDLAIVALLTILLSYTGMLWRASSVLVSPSLGIPRTVLASAALLSYGISIVFCLESVARSLAGLPRARRLAPDDEPEPSPA